MYCFTNWRPAKDGYDGKEPDLPKGVSFLAAWSPGKGDSEWCLCEILIDDSFDDDSFELERVNNALEILLDSAKGYPPALAIALHNASLKWPISKLEYSQLLVQLLKQRIRSQVDDAFVLAEATVEETGYLSVGEFVWLIRYFPETAEVLWVSSDFNLYRNSISNFRITAERLQKIKNTGNYRT